jgi:hypothetical protein
MSKLAAPPALNAETFDSIESEKELAYKQKALKVRGASLLALAFSTLGIIYSDIGESGLHSVSRSSA